MIAVLIPVLNRPQRVKPLLDSLARSQRHLKEPIAKAYFVANESDALEVAAIRKERAALLLAKGTTWAKKINHGYRCTKEPWMLCGADDLEFRDGWTDVFIPHAKLVGVVGTNDLGNSETMNGRHSTHPLVTRAYADEFGTEDGKGSICHEGYHHTYVDNEIAETAKKRGRWFHLKDCLIEHLHPVWGKGKMDATYTLGMSRVRQDHALFEARKAKFGWGR